MFPSFGKGAGRSLHISFLGSWVDGWALPLPRSWAPVGLRSCFLSGLLGRMGEPRPRSWVLLGSLHVSFFLGPGSGWVGRGKEAGLSLGSLHIPFWAPGSDGWSGQEAGVALASLHASFFLGPGSDGWEAAEKLGSRWAPFMFPSLLGFGLSIFPYCAPGSGWVVRGLGFRWAPFTDGWAAAKELDARHVSFLGSWVCSCSRLGWMGRAHKAGLQWPPFAAKAAPITKLPSCFVFGLLGWMGGPRDFYCLACLSLCFFVLFSCLVCWFVPAFCPTFFGAPSTHSTHIITIPRTGVSHTIGF